MRIVTKIKDWLDTNKALRMVAENKQITSELILLVRVIFADGMMRPEENQCFKEICKTEFGISEKDFLHIFDYLRDIGHEISLKDAASIFKGLDTESKRSLIARMYRVAESDFEVVLEELEVIRRTADILGLNANDVTLKAA